MPWRGLILSLGLGCVVYAVIGLLADLDLLGEALETYSRWTFAVALALSFTNYLIRFVKWQYYLGLLELRVPWLESFLVFLAGFVMSVTPAKVGEVLRSVLLLETRGIPIERTAPIVIADRLSDMLALILLMTAGAAMFQQGWIVAVVGFAMCSLVVVAVQIPAVGLSLVSLARKLPVLCRAGDRLQAAYESLRTVGSAQVLALPVLLSVGGWFCECLAFYIVLRGFPGGQIELLTATFIYSMATVAGAVAMLPGGLGATEASMAGMLNALPTGLSSAQCAAGTVLIRLATLWFAVGVGLLALSVLRQRMKMQR